MKKSINIKGKLFDLSHPKVMGIINLTGDSFYAKSRAKSDKEIISKVRQMLIDGADIIDIGAYSTRPGADDVSESVEKSIILEAISLVKSEFENCLISVDTFRSVVAEEAILAGADLINDVTGGNLDNNMFDVIAKYEVPYILMHMRGNPKTMTNLCNYENVLLDVIKELKIKIDRLKSLGLKDIIVDPGFGFAKDIDQNYQLLSNMEMLKSLDMPILIGVSRKSMIYKFLNSTADQSLCGTVALNFFALQNGANILRVHDVKEARQIVQLFAKINNSKNPFTVK
jgi:dihydropteroate synthase